MHPWGGRSCVWVPELEPPHEDLNGESTVSVYVLAAKANFGVYFLAPELTSLAGRASRSSSARAGPICQLYTVQVACWRKGLCALQVLGVWYCFQQGHGHSFPSLLDRGVGPQRSWTQDCGSAPTGWEAGPCTEFSEEPFLLFLWSLQSPSQGAVACRTWYSPGVLVNDCVVSFPEWTPSGAGSFFFHWHWRSCSWRLHSLTMRESVTISVSLCNFRVKEMAVFQIALAHVNYANTCTLRTLCVIWLSSEVDFVQ